MLEQSRTLNGVECNHEDVQTFSEVLHSHYYFLKSTSGSFYDSWKILRFQLSIDNRQFYECRTSVIFVKIIANKTLAGSRGARGVLVGC